jgi:hypothetical protein
MRTATIAALALSLTAATAFAQSTTGTSTTGTTSPGGGIGRGAPALSPKSSGPVTPNRSNTDVFPPSRLLPPTGGSVSTQQTQTPGSTSAGTTSATGTPTTGQSTTQGGTSTTPGTTPGDASTATSTSGTQTSGNAMATTSDGQSNAGGATGPIKPIPADVVRVWQLWPRFGPAVFHAHRQERPQRDRHGLHEDLGARHAHEQGRLATHMPARAGPA